MIFQACYAFQIIILKLQSELTRFAANQNNLCQHTVTSLSEFLVQDDNKNCIKNNEEWLNNVAVSVRFD